MNKNIENAVKRDEANVSQVAYHLWENAGRPTGRDLDFWLTAESQVRASQMAMTAMAHSTVPATPASNDKAQKSRAPRGVKKNWPKPYPALPKF